MGIKGIELDRTNPRYKVSDFLVWMPQFKKYLETNEGQRAFTMMKKICNEKIFHSILGVDWYLGMSYGIAHYLTLIQQQQSNPGGSSLASIGGGSPKGVLSSASVGGFNQSYDFSLSMISEKENMFWNQTEYGKNLMLLYQTKAIPTMFVITDDRRK